MYFESASTGAFSALVGFVVCGAGPNGAGVAMWSMRCAVASKVGARERSQVMVPGALAQAAHAAGQ